MDKDKRIIINNILDAMIGINDMNLYALDLENLIDLDCKFRSLEWEIEKKIKSASPEKVTGDAQTKTFN